VLSKKAKPNCGDRPNCRVATAYREPLYAMNIMNKSIKSLLLMFVVCIAAYSGFVFGKQKRQQELDHQLELINYSTWATDVKIDLDLLKPESVRLQS
jgi:hypothetical protein